MQSDRALGHRQYPQQALPPPVRRRYHGTSEVYEIRSKEDEYLDEYFHYLAIFTTKKMEISAGKPNHEAINVTTCP